MILPICSFDHSLMIAALMYSVYKLLRNINCLKLLMLMLSCKPCRPYKLDATRYYQIAISCCYLKKVNWYQAKAKSKAKKQRRVVASCSAGTCFQSNQCPTINTSLREGTGRSLIHVGSSIAVKQSRNLKRNYPVAIEACSQTKLNKQTC